MTPAHNTQDGPPVWVAQWVRMLSGYADAMDVRWADIGIPPDRPDQFAFVCGCQVPSALMKPASPGEYAPINHVELTRKMAREVHGGPFYDVWVGRCQKCKTIYWAGPRRATP